MNKVICLMHSRKTTIKNSDVPGSLLSGQSLCYTSERHLSFQLPCCFVLGGVESTLNSFFLVVQLYYFQTQ